MHAASLEQTLAAKQSLQVLTSRYGMQIVEGLIQLAIANEIGHGPSLKEAMEREVNEQVGPSPSRAASKSGSQKGQG